MKRFQLIGIGLSGASPPNLRHPGLDPRIQDQADVQFRAMPTKGLLFGSSGPARDDGGEVCVPALHVCRTEGVWQASTSSASANNNLFSKDNRRHKNGQPRKGISSLYSLSLPAFSCAITRMTHAAASLREANGSRPGTGKRGFPEAQPQLGDCALYVPNDRHAVKAYFPIFVNFR